MVQMIAGFFTGFFIGVFGRLLPTAIFPPGRGHAPDGAGGGPPAKTPPAPGGPQRSLNKTRKMRPGTDAVPGRNSALICFQLVGETLESTCMPMPAVWAETSEARYRAALATSSGLA